MVLASWWVGVGGTGAGGWVVAALLVVMFVLLLMARLSYLSEMARRTDGLTRPAVGAVLPLLTKAVRGP